MGNFDVGPEGINPCGAAAAREGHRLRVDLLAVWSSRQATAAMAAQRDFSP